MLGVTIDTNVYVSAFAFGGKPIELLELAARQEILLAISEPILQETIGVLRDKFRWNEAALSEVDATLRSIAQVVTPTRTLNVISYDEPDNRILECAQEAGSEFIISSDKDLLRLKTFGQAKVVKVADFLRQERQR